MQSQNQTPTADTDLTRAYLHVRGAGLTAALTATETFGTAAQLSVERVAEMFDAEVAAIVDTERVMASVGYRRTAVPSEDLLAVATAASDKLVVPGCGTCPASAAPLYHPSGATLVLARSDSEGLSQHEMALFRACARIISFRLSTLHLLEEERRLREESVTQALELARLAEILAERQDELESLASEQAALRRVATLVATGVSQDRLFAAVAEEISKLVQADHVVMGRYEPDGSVVVEASWGNRADVMKVGSRQRIGGRNLVTIVHQFGQPARIDDPGLLSGEPAFFWEEWQLRSAVASPLVVAGRLWGLVVVATSGQSRLMPADSEERTARFSELIATAIANAEARADLAASRSRVVAAGDEMRRRIERNLHDGTQQRLITLALKLHSAHDNVPEELSDLRKQLSVLEGGMDDLLEELREISRGLHPAVLSEAGLAPALRSLARRAALPVDLHIDGVGRLPEAVEVAGYYVVSEALANATKHARASSVDVTVEPQDGTLRICVDDDGIGGADPALGSGLIGLRDRVEALGGTISVSSQRASGTTIEVKLPLARDRRYPTHS